MATIIRNDKVQVRKEEQVFQVVHPLDDAPETKVSLDGLGLMPMKAGVRISLFTLRAYLILMMIMVLYSVLHQAGVFGH